MANQAGLTLTGARLVGRDGMYELHIAHGRLTSVRLVGSSTQWHAGGTRASAKGVGEARALGPHSADTGEMLDLGGRFVMPGLWDNHVHFTQWVIRQSRLDLTDTHSAAEVLAKVRQGLSRRCDGDMPPVLVGYGFRDAAWSDEPSLRDLDELTGQQPTVLVSGDLHCGWCNSAACALLGIAVPATGLSRERPWMDALEMLDHQMQPTVSDYAAAAAGAAQRGVVGIVDFENAPLTTQWPERVRAGVTSLRVECGIWPEYLDAAIESGHRTGDVLDPSGLVMAGRLKIIADGSLNTRTAWCWDPYPPRKVASRGDVNPGRDGDVGVSSYSVDEIEKLVARAAAHGILPAIHAIGDRCNHEVLGVFDRLGVAGAIEHAQLVTAADLKMFGSLHVIASVQPEHAMDDRDVADYYWAGRTDGAFAYRSLLDGGAELRLGSDAPVAPLDPWIAISAAVSRSRDGRPAWHPDQCLATTEALAASTRTRLEPGQPADLAVIETDPLSASSDELRAMNVAATMVAGRWTWRAI